MKQLKVIIFLLTTVILGVCTGFGYDIIYEKMNRLMDKSGLRQKIIDSQTRIPDAVIISSPHNSEILSSSTIVVQGTATGKKIQFVEVRLDSGAGQGTWVRASGVSSWQSIFTERSNNNAYTVRARAYNEKGYGEEAIVNFSVQSHGPIVRVSPTNSVLTSQNLTITLSVNEKWGYWATNQGPFYQFSSSANVPVFVQSNVILKYYGQDVLNNTSTTQSKKYVWQTPGLAFTRNGSTFNVAAGTATTGSIVIPSTYSNFPITTISANAFDGCIGITSVFIPDSVTSIENEAFQSCTGLTNVTIGNNVTSIGWYAFRNCPGLKSFLISDSVTSIGGEAFKDCTGLTSIIIPESVTSINQFAFDHCTGLTNAIIGNSVTSIGGYAFYACQSLSSITIPNSVTSIGQSAFSYCINLSSITIPEKVTFIGDRTFQNCTGLTNVIMNGTNAPLLSVGGHNLFFGCPLTAIHVPNNGSSLTNYKNAWTSYSNIIVTP